LPLQFRRVENPSLKAHDYLDLCLLERITCPERYFVHALRIARITVFRQFAEAGGFIVSRSFLRIVYTVPIMIDSSDSARLSPVTLAIEAVLRSIPKGKVTTYGEIARAAGFPNGARQVARVLHSRSSVAALPWHRVLGRGSGAGFARISLADDGFAEQSALLASEGIEVSPEGAVDLSRFGFFH
jgi:methylated-DNA-protein-cysteine methyltransferase-like protein